MVTKKLLNLKEVFDKLDPAEFSRSLEDASMLMVDSVIKEIAMKYIPDTWDSLSEETKNEVVILAHQESPGFLTELMKDVQDNIYDVLDLKDMSIKACVENKGVLNKIFKETGDKVCCSCMTEIFVEILFNYFRFVWLQKCKYGRSLFL